MSAVNIEDWSASSSTAQSVNNTSLLINVIAGAGDEDASSRFVEAIVEDETTTHEQWLDVVHACQAYGYHDF